MPSVINNNCITHSPIASDTKNTRTYTNTEQSKIYPRAKIIILGSGAAPGVPTISDGWGECNPHNSKNKRSRAGIYVELGHNRFLIDTSADLRNQLLYNNIRSVDAVFYTHVHADHVMGIDDLRSMNYGIKQLSSLHTIKAKLLDIFATDEHITEIRRRFSYVLADENSDEITHRPQLKPNAIAYNQPFNIGTTHIMPLKFTGHPVTTTGYVFNNGQLVIVPDYKVMPPETLAYLQQIEIKVMIMPLTKINNCLYHADMNINKQYIDAIRPQKTIFTHLGPECDYDAVKKLCDTNMEPAYDNMIIEL